MNAAANMQRKQLEGVERAALLLLALGPEFGASVWEEFSEDEIKEISMAMARLGSVDGHAMEETLVGFLSRMGDSGAVMGNYDSTERLLTRFLPQDRVGTIMSEIRGPAGRNMWEKLSNVQEDVLANYLKNEYPQTVAVVLSKIRPDHAARVLAILPEDFAMEVVARMLRMESVQKEILERVEQTLRTEFMSNLAQTARRDAHEQMAEIFIGFDRQTESRFMTALEERNRDAAERIKSLMFTFEDLAKLDSGSIQTLLRSVEKDKLAIALKGAPEAIRDFFFANMSSRAAANMKDDMASLGPVRLKDVDEAQSTMVNIAKDMAARGEIIISKSRGGDDELVY
ncbi:MAG: flagellar motor switch protein FliG [Pseudomonadota bacterium]